MHNGLCDCIPRRIVGVEDPPPVGVDLVNLVAIPERMRAVLSHQVGNLTPRLVRLGHVLAQAVGHIDPKPVGSASAAGSMNWLVEIPEAGAGGP
jgi:hypothetical protein